MHLSLNLYIYIININQYFMIKKNTQNDKQIDTKNTKKDPSTSQKNNSGFTKKCKNINQSNQFKFPILHEKPQDLQNKKKSKSARRKAQKQQKQTKLKLQGHNIKDQQAEFIQNKSQQQNEQNIIHSQQYVQDCAKQLSNQVIRNIQKGVNKQQQQKISNINSNKKNEQLVQSCSVQKLKRIRSSKMEDTDFFQLNQHQNPSKRLLILEYENQQVYIHQNNQKHLQKNAYKINKVPDNIKNVFQKKQFLFFNNNEPTRLKTQQTYDTSNPSSYSNKFTPRSNSSPQPPVRERTNSYTNQISVNYMNSIYEQYTQQQKYEYQQYYQQYQYYNDQKGKNINRKRRIISYQQSKAYIIDISKIQTDGRTTVMIRNIPNKYTRDMLLDLIQTKNKKKFDFFYLPIDYSNQCNMGYAFINFIHSKFIKDFYKQFDGQKWQKFNSEKICSLTYARIQGTFSLMTHFQNAGVMHQKQRKIRPLIDVDEQFMNNLSTIIQKQKQNN